MAGRFAGKFCFAFRTLISLALLAMAGPTAGLASQPVHWVFTDYPPANFIAATGEPAGFFCDIVMEALEKRMG